MGQHSEKPSPYPISERLRLRQRLRWRLRIPSGTEVPLGIMLLTSVIGLLLGFLLGLLV